jgi:hypothetical protein
MTVQNNAAVTSVIQANMDEMAKALAKQTSATAAWAAIFRKPAAKQWSAVNVAIKVNCIAENHPRLAVVDKICRVLNTIGVPYANIIIYDGCSGASGLYNSFVGTRLPTGVRVSNYNSLLGNTVSAPVPAPYNGNQNCTANIANGTIDILVNIACNKGHDDTYGRVTLTMKNHYGTFDPGPHSYNYTVGINMSEAIVGGTPPRQQLCIIDSLWGMKPGPGGVPGDGISGGERPNIYRLIMGTFGPAVDFLTCKKVRETELSAPSAANVNNFLTSFGYTTTDRDQLLTLTPGPQTGTRGWVEVSPASSTVAGSSAAAGQGHGLTLYVGRGPSVSSVRFVLPQPVNGGRIAILDSQGRLIRELALGNSQVVAWDGSRADGGIAAAGTYLVRVASGGSTQAGSVTLY